MVSLNVSWSYMLFTTLHVFQFALALAVCALYGMDLNKASHAGKYMDGKWIFAVVVGAISAVTTCFYFVPFILRLVVVPAWSAVMFVLWIALFGVFGKMYIHEDPEGNAGVSRMKNAVWVDLAAALLWLIDAVAVGTYWWFHRDHLTRFTGRAKLGRGASIRSRV